ETRHSRAPGVVIFSLKVWLKLSPSDRTLLQWAAISSVSTMRQSLDAYEARARAQAVKEGVRVIEDVDRKSFSEILLPMYPSLLPPAKQRDLLARIQAVEQAANP